MTPEERARQLQNDRIVPQRIVGTDGTFINPADRIAAAIREAVEEVRESCVNIIRADRAEMNKLLEEANAASQPLSWSKEPPKVPGWYWFRPEPQTPRPYMRMVEQATDGTLHAAFRGPYQPVVEIVGEWAGPLLPPQS